MRTTLLIEDFAPLVEGRHENPHHVLGPHPVSHEGRKALAVRAYLPHCDSAWVVDSAHNATRPMRRIHPSGFYEAILPARADKDIHDYQLRTADPSGRETTMHDPYAFGNLLTDFDLYLLGEGTHWKSYERLGAQLRRIGDVEGVNFAVWAPNAESVSVIGDFNGWDGRRHMMRKHIPSGVWEMFVPGLGENTLYKFQLRQHGRTLEKADPYGFAAELPPRTASKVANLDTYHWNDRDWMTARRETNWLERPMSIYELHLGSWQRDDADPSRWLTYRELAFRLVEYCRRMNYTHVQLMPISEHPFSGSWGYQTVGYYAATSRYGTPQDCMYFVDQLHQAGIGVLIDWVPAHFPRDAHGLWRFDGSALYEHSDPRQGEHPDWGTMVFNYGRNEVRNFLVSNALFWLDKYHIDGLRVDAVASMLYLDYSREEGEWIPNRYGGRENIEAIEFVKQFNEQVHLHHPGALTVAEESTAWPAVSRPTYVGGLGFSLKWNMGWMNDTRRYMAHDPIHRQYHHDELTFSLIYAFHENFILPLSHDEVVHGKGSLLDQMPGDMWQRFANLRLLYAYMWTHPGKKLLFMGGDIAQWTEWNYDGNLQWDLLQWPLHQGMQQLVADLNGLLKREPSLYERDFDHHGFEWIDCNNRQDCVLAYLRRAADPDDYIVTAMNFTPVPRHNYRIGVPEACWYQEVFNTDSQHYAGSNVGNGPGKTATEPGHHGRPAAIEISLPPLAAVMFKPCR